MVSGQGGDGEGMAREHGGDDGMKRCMAAMMLMKLNYR
jgi:hypothetical protein